MFQGRIHYSGCSLGTDVHDTSAVVEICMERVKAVNIMCHWQKSFLKFKKLSIIHEQMFSDAS